MSTFNPGCKALNLGGSTLAELLKRVLADGDVPLKKRQDTASAIRGFSDALRLPPESIPASPTHLRSLLKDFTPAMASLSAHRWRNIRSLVVEHFPEMPRAEMFQW